MSELLQKGRVKSKAELFRDTRPFFTKFFEWLTNGGSYVALSITLLVSLFSDNLGFLMFLISGAIFYAIFSKRMLYPLFAPKSLEQHDYKIPPPGKDVGSSKASGISYLGHDKTTNLPVYSNNDVDRQHKFILATTGGGKTQNIIAVDIVASAMIQASGYVLVDGKATIDAALQAMGVMRRFYREQDALFINFMKGDKDFRVRNEEMITHSFNPLTYGTNSQISELLKPLLGDGSKGGDSDVWKKRAETYIDGTTRIYCYLRDEGYLKFSVGTYRDYLSLEGTIRLFYGQLDSVTKIDIPYDITESLGTFLLTTAGIDETVMLEVSNGNTDVLTDTAGEQFNFISMQIAPMLNLTATDYAHIFNHKDADVDLEDVILNRRGLIIMLPTLAYAESTVQVLAQIIIAAIKSMMAKQLGSSLEGSPQDILARRAFAAPSAFKLQFDEVTYYLTAGMDIIAAQGRGLGVAVTYGTQELGAALERNKIVTSAVWGSTNVKVFGKIEDSGASLDMITKRLGEVSFSQINSYNVNVDDHGNSSVQEPSSISLDRRAELDIKDLSKLREGEQYLTYGAQVIHLQAFYVPEKEYMADQVRLNQFVAVSDPTLEEVALLKRSSMSSVISRLNGIIKGEILLDDYIASESNGHSEYKNLITVLGVHDALRSQGAAQLDKGLCAVQSLVESLKSAKGSVQNNAATRFKELADKADGAEPENPEPSHSFSIEESLKALNNDSIEINFDYSEIDEEADYLPELPENFTAPSLNDFLSESHVPSAASIDEIEESASVQVKRIVEASGNSDDEQDSIVDLIIHEALEHPKPPVPNFSKEETVAKFKEFISTLSNKL